jgi:hypothetical protein
MLHNIRLERLSYIKKLQLIGPIRKLKRKLSVVNSAPGVKATDTK